MREKFWKSRRQNKSIWNVLREVCEAEDNETAELILRAGMMNCVDGNIKQTFFVSNPGHVFRIPNFCIADPVYEKNYEESIKKCQNTSEIKIIIILSFLVDKNKTKNIKIETTNKKTVKEIKNIFCEKVGLNVNKNIDKENDNEKGDNDEENKDKNKDEISLRMFYEGQELLDDNLLCYNNIKNMSKIHVMIYNNK